MLGGVLLLGNNDRFSERSFVAHLESPGRKSWEMKVFCD